MFQFYPFSNFHQLNLDWLLETVKSLPKTVNQIAPDENGNINIPGMIGGITPIENGGTGMDSVQMTDTISDIATEETDFTITAARISYWGKIATIRILITTTNALTGNHKWATLKPGFRAGYETPLSMQTGSVTGFAYISTGSGEIHTVGSVPAGTTVPFEGVYMLE